jgi:hypothetical protein
MDRKRTVVAQATLDREHRAVAVGQRSALRPSRPAVATVERGTVRPSRPAAEERNTVRPSRPAVVVADERNARRPNRSVRRFLAALGSTLVFGFKLAAGVVAFAFIAIALWGVANRLMSDAAQSTDPAQGVGAPPEAVAAHGATELQDSNGELRPPPSNFPRPVKTIRFTPPDN